MVTENTITITPADKTGFTLQELAEVIPVIRDQNPYDECVIKAHTTIGLKIKKITITLRANN